jgi:hypothetical protein
MWKWYETLAAKFAVMHKRRHRLNVIVSARRNLRRRGSPMRRREFIAGPGEKPIRLAEVRAACSDWATTDSS